MKTEIEKELLEKLAELEHEQWQTWRKTIEWRFRRCVPQNEYTNISYNKLPEKIKEQDRKWARLILKILNQEISKIRSSCIKEAGFKDADEEIARLQDEYEKALLQTALRKYKEGYNLALKEVFAEIERGYCVLWDGENKLYIPAVKKVWIDGIKKHFGVDDVKKKVK